MAYSAWVMSWLSHTQSHQSILQHRVQEREETHSKCMWFGTQGKGPTTHSQTPRSQSRWHGWMASTTPRTWIWTRPRCWWWTGKPGVQITGSQRVGLDSMAELKWSASSFQMYCGHSIRSLVKPWWPSLGTVYQLQEKVCEDWDFVHYLHTLSSVLKRVPDTNSSSINPETSEHYQDYNHDSCLRNTA